MELTRQQLFAGSTFFLAEARRRNGDEEKIDFRGVADLSVGPGATVEPGTTQPGTAARRTGCRVVLRAIAVKFPVERRVE